MIPPVRSTENMPRPALISLGTELHLSNVAEGKCPRVLLKNVSEMLLGTRERVSSNPNPQGR
jgi:hypothetical protein